MIAINLTTMQGVLMVRYEWKDAEKLARWENREICYFNSRYV